MLDFDKLAAQAEDLARYQFNKANAAKASGTVVADFSGRGRNMSAKELNDLRALIGKSGDITTLEFVFVQRAPQTSLIAASTESKQLGIGEWDCILLPTDPQAAAALVATLNRLTDGKPDCLFARIVNKQIELVEAVDVAGELSIE